MLHRNLSASIFVCALAFSSLATAENFILTDMFDGSEAKTDPLPGTCNSTIEPLRYDVVSPVTVSTTQNYVIQDVYNFGDGIDVSVLVYQGSFDPGNPNANLITPNGIDVFDSVTLNAGVEYTFVVQQWCQNLEGAWAVSISGGGTVTAGVLADLPEVTEGAITLSDPTASLPCGNTNYVAVDNQTVSNTGTYYYNDLSIVFDLDMCLHIYQGSFNPDSPATNLVTTLDDVGTVDLDAGQNYVFVIQPFDAAEAGEYFFALSPPAPFAISSNMAGAWEYSVTAGSGLFMDVFDENNLMFIAWFTYDLERPDPSVTAMIGDPGHRWVTGIGPFTGDTATLDLYWTSGMVFDSATPPPSTEQDGSMTIEFESCTAGQVTYDLGIAGVSGDFPISRLSAENSAVCESRYRGPGMPGPL